MDADIIKEYASGISISHIAKNHKHSRTTVMRILEEGGVKTRKRGQRYVIPPRDEFSRDCALLRWHELSHKYNVSWQTIKNWKSKYGLTTGKKENRFVDVVEEDSGCWKCISHKSAKGYPRGRKGELIVKRMWVERNGSWPKRKLVRHLCDTKWCVNPDHVVPGTQFENLVDCVLDGKGKSEKKYVDSLLTNAYKRGVIYFEDGLVVRTIDGKVFPIVGTVEKKVITRYVGDFKRTTQIPRSDVVLNGGDRKRGSRSEH